MIKNDTRPVIKWADLGENTLGACDRRLNYGPIIYMHNAFKYNQDLVDDYFMNTLIHEYIHGLKSCAAEGHQGEWKRIADLITLNTSYIIDQYASGAKSKAFEIAKNKMKNK